MTVGQALGWLWRIALALLLLKLLADPASRGPVTFAIFGLILPVEIVIFIRARKSTRNGQGAIDKAEKVAGILRQLSEPDQIRVACLAVSGNVIQAIRTVRNLVDTDLPTAKEVVDQLVALHR